MEKNAIKLPAASKICGKSSEEVPDWNLNTLQEIQQFIDSSPRMEQPEDAFSMVFDAIQSAISGIIIADTEGYIVYANQAFLSMFEYDDKSEVLGNDAAEIFPGGEVRKLSDVTLITNISDNQAEEFVVRRKNGDMFVAEATSSPVTNSAGRIVGRMASFVDITKRKRAEEEKERTMQKLRTALENIKTLRGLVPICAYCKSIRDDKGFWQQVEKYVEDNSEAVFSHGVCPDCIKKHFPDLVDEIEERKQAQSVSA